jgi:hypothetical protein
MKRSSARRGATTRRPRRRGISLQDELIGEVARDAEQLCRVRDREGECPVIHRARTAVIGCDHGFRCTFTSLSAQLPRRCRWRRERLGRTGESPLPRRGVPRGATGGATGAHRPRCDGCEPRDGPPRALVPPPPAKVPRRFDAWPYDLRSGVVTRVIGSLTEGLEHDEWDCGHDGTGRAMSAASITWRARRSAERRGLGPG